MPSSPTILPTELIDLILDETVPSVTNDSFGPRILSTLALVNTHFRQRANAIRFHTISFCYCIRDYSPGHMAQFGHLLETDSRVWGATRGVARHIARCTTRIIGQCERSRVLRVLHNGTLVQIMRRAFRSFPGGEDSERERGHFSLTCSAQREYDADAVDALEWHDLNREFRDAFRQMCAAGQIGELHLGGLLNFPAELICGSDIRTLHLECMTFQAVGQGVALARSRHLEKLVIQGTEATIPDSLLANIKTFAVHPLEGDEDLLKLVDDFQRVPRLETLHLLSLNPVLQKFAAKDLETIKVHLPQLCTLRLGIDIWTEYNAFDEIFFLPAAFILGQNMPSSVKKIEIDLKFFLFFSQTKGDLLETLLNLLQLCNLGKLDSQLTNSPHHAPALERICVWVSMMQQQLDLDMNGYEEDARDVVCAFFPETMALEGIEVDIRALQSNCEWSPYRRLEIDEARESTDMTSVVG